MKAMLIKSYGEDAKFELAEIEKPQVRAGYFAVRAGFDVGALQGLVVARRVYTDSDAAQFQTRTARGNSS